MCVFVHLVVFFSCNNDYLFIPKMPRQIKKSEKGHGRAKVRTVQILFFFKELKLKLDVLLNVSGVLLFVVMSISLWIFRWKKIFRKNTDLQGWWVVLGKVIISFKFHHYIVVDIHFQWKHLTLRIKILSCSLQTVNG